LHNPKAVIDPDNLVATQESISATGHSDSFWDAYQPGFRFSEHEPGSAEFFAEVERHRYQLEPHIPELAQFPRWEGRDVLDVGCGIATDGIQFARHGARYTGVDLSMTALDLARRRFELEGLPAEVLAAPANDLPFGDESFDLVYSHGVIHHMEDTRGTVQEFHRILRPGGSALVMVYHRNSVNYRLNIMVLRRLLAATLLVPGMPRLVADLTGESPSVLQGHRALLREHGLRYLTDRKLFLSNNTDGPGNPLSKAYTGEEVRKLFRDFPTVRTCARYLNLRLLPAGRRLEKSRLGNWLGHRAGWHLYVLAVK